jgi:hypothetical protein
MYNKEFFKQKYGIEVDTTMSDKEGHTSVVSIDDEEQEVLLAWISTETGIKHHMYFTYEWLVSAMEKKIMWVVPEYKSQQNNINAREYPNICPYCGNPAYIGINNIDCSNCKGR